MPGSESAVSWDPVWEKIFRAQAWGKYPPLELVRFVARNFYSASDRKSVRLLEVGCGPGANLWFMAREGFSVYGIDGAETAIQNAKQRLDSECPGWSGALTSGDIGKLPYPDAHFDAVIDVEAIYANPFDNSKHIYSELARVTKPSGKLFSITFAAGSWGDKTGKSVGRNAWLTAEGPMAGAGYARFTKLDEIDELAAGFRITDVELISRTMNGRKNEIREWIIEGVKL